MSYSAPAAGVPLIEIVIPVRNEQRELTDHVTRLVEHLRAGFPYAWLVTIADNGSTDGTWSLAQELADRHPGLVRAVHLELPGRGRALHAVWSASDADVRRLHGRGPVHRPEGAAARWSRRWCSGQADVSVGTRLAPGAHVVRGLKREVISRAYNLLLRMVLRVGFSDAQCGFKALRGDAARALLPLVEDRAGSSTPSCSCSPSGPGCASTRSRWTGPTPPTPGSKIIPTALGDLRGIWRLRWGCSPGRSRCRGSAAQPLRGRHGRPRQLEESTPMSATTVTAPGLARTAGRGLAGTAARPVARPGPRPGLGAARAARPARRHRRCSTCST